MGGEKYKFQGKEYGVFYNSHTAEQIESLYGAELKRKGYSLPGEIVHSFAMIRNMTNHQRVSIYYLVAESMIPQEVLDAPAKIKQYLLDQLNEKLVLVQEA